MKLSVRFAALAAAAALALPALVHAQTGVSITPYAGYLVPGNILDGPLGTSLTTTNAPMFGAQASIPLTRGVSLVGNLAYASGDLEVGLPILGGINVGTSKTFFYDAGIELGGLAGKGAVGVKPFVQGGIGGMTSDIKNGLINTRSSNIAYSAGVGVDVGVSKGFALRIQAKDWIGKFDTKEAVGFKSNTNLAHNWALTAGIKLAF
jgi:hypothetical protein